MVDALPRGATGLSAVCDCVFFSDHTHLLFLKVTNQIKPNERVFFNIRIETKSSCCRIIYYDEETSIIS